MIIMPRHVLVVGSITDPELYTLEFTPPSKGLKPGKLEIIKCFPTCAAHSWIHLTHHHNRTNLYATAWVDPPCVVAYQVHSPSDIRELNRAPTASRSGYVTASATTLYSAGGANGDVFALDCSTGAFKTDANKQVTPLQRQEFIDEHAQRDNGTTMDFGGLRHGAHSADLSKDGRAYYVADIGRNCIWTYSVSPSDGTLTFGEKHISPRKDDGPRHAWPHPNGRVLYVVQEHTSVIDVFRMDETGTRLRHAQGVRIIPESENASDYWADEVRTSFSNGDSPQWLYASNRGLTKGKKGYVCVYKLRRDGLIDSAPEVRGDGQLQDGYGGLKCMWETPTSGGWANAVQPGPTIDGIEYIALTDSEVGWVFILAWDGKQIKEVARALLNGGSGAATALWLYE